MKIIWTPIDKKSNHKLVIFVGRAFEDQIFLDVEIGPKNNIGAEYFKLFLNVNNQRSLEPLILGLINTGKYPGNNWLEILVYRSALFFSDSSQFIVSEKLELDFFEKLGDLIPSGGHMMIEYDSNIRRLTARSLLVGVPPDATPVGRLLYIAGCGFSIRDWYIPEGGREGMRKLQGFKPLDRNHQISSAVKRIGVIKSYIDSELDIEWDLRGYTLPIAEQAYNFLSDIIKCEN